MQLAGCEGFSYCIVQADKDIGTKNRFPQSIHPQRIKTITLKLASPLHLVLIASRIGNGADLVREQGQPVLTQRLADFCRLGSDFDRE